MPEGWIFVWAWNSATGFKKYLALNDVKTVKKRQEITDRLLRGEVIELNFGSHRLLYKDDIGIFYLERKKEEKGAKAS